MKLRNKKDGEIVEVSFGNRDGKINVMLVDMSPSGYSLLGEYASLAELNEEWEDYTPKEPLIMDEKIRKAVRAWAEASYLRGAIFDFDDGTMMLRGENHRASISFDGFDFCEFRHITAEYHTIAELCGEEGE